MLLEKNHNLCSLCWAFWYFEKNKNKKSKDQKEKRKVKVFFSFILSTCFFLILDGRIKRKKTGKDQEKHDKRELFSLQFNIFRRQLPQLLFFGVK